MKRIVEIVKQQQLGTEEQFGHEFYKFTRLTSTSTETLQLNGMGSPAKRTGMSRSFFRPSDDACTFSFLIPSNAMMSVELFHLSGMVTALKLDDSFATEVLELSAEIRSAIYQYGVVDHPKFGKIFAYEVDGYGSSLLMDDANIPSLLSLPYLGFIDIDDDTYIRTRKYVLSEYNPYFFKGTTGFQGIGGPHVGWHQIWPMSIIMRALTSNDEGEIKYCLDTITQTDAGSFFIHESFDQSNPNRYTRPWFAWANSLFGELIFYLAESPYSHLLFDDDVESHAQM